MSYIEKMEDKTKLIEERADYLFYSMLAKTREQALSQSANELKAYEYIAKMGSLFDIVF